jgi:hypothetical protein
MASPEATPPTDTAHLEAKKTAQAAEGTVVFTCPEFMSGSSLAYGINQLCPGLAISYDGQTVVLQDRFDTHRWIRMVLDPPASIGDC